MLLWPRDCLLIIANGAAGRNSRKKFSRGEAVFIKLNTAERAAIALSAVLLSLMALRCCSASAAGQALRPSAPATAARAVPSEPAEAHSAPPDEPAEETDASPALPLDLNAASLEELTALPGIGPARARAILEWREESGPFRYVEDLIQVPGIGEGIFAGLEGYVTVGGG